ncbi:MAG: hypothetical protein WBD27_15505 [Pyrinomonadaceae bacterium]
MKRCPKCNADYFDNMLEFCLEDGTRLTFASQSTGATTARTIPQTPTVGQQPAPLSNLNSEETVVIRNVGDAKPTITDTPLQIAEQSQTAKILETAPIVLALAHNWWQWLYLEKQYVSSITDYILSANFLMWLLLLASGILVSLLAVKHSKNKTLGIISMVALAINLILFLVPRR